MSGHTSGPWEVESVGFQLEASKCVSIGAPRDWESFAMVVVRMDGDESDSVVGWANAHLIAAAPDLLAVVLELEESAGYWSEYDVPLGIVDRIRAAISKARGGELCT